MKQKLYLPVLALCLALLVSCGRVPTERIAGESASPEPGASSQPGASLLESSVPPERSVPSSGAESADSAGPESPVSAEESAQNEASVVSAAVSEPQGPDAGGANPFTIGKDEIYDLYLYHPGQIAYGLLESYFYSPRPEPDHPIVLALNALPPLPETEAQPGARIQTGFLIVREGYQKTQINLLDHALEVDGTCYALTGDQYEQLKKLADEAAAGEGPNGQHAQWLIWMNPERVTNIECIDETGRSFQIKRENMLLSAMEPRYIAVSAGGTYAPGSVDFADMNGAFQTVLTFDNGVTYTMVLEGDNLYLESSDMNTACRYKTSQTAGHYIAAMRDAENGTMNPRTGKPVIYLYPEKTQDVSVGLNFKGRLSYTYPAYDGGWRVTAEPDGTLTNKADGSEHYYLFWEGTADFDAWDFSEGFVVKGRDAERFLKEKLPALGLTPREYNDFITYWAPELTQNAYNLVTFSTAQYEAVAPLDISPTPDTVLRVHMVYKPIPGPVSVKEQVLPAPPARNGFTVVEWGGTRAW